MSDFMNQIFIMLDSRVPEWYWERKEVRQASERLQTLERAVKDALDETQYALWQEYQDAQLRMTEMDDLALFENTLALGMELGRLGRGGEDGGDS